jgi:hypothetical protein
LLPSIVILVASSVSLLLRALVPFNVTGVGAGYYDQALFAREAVALQDGQWLGVFDKVTLAKGPAYPMFIAGLREIHVSPPMGAQLTYLAASLALALAFYRLTHQARAAAFVYAVLVLDPVNYTGSPAEILRDNWYGGLSLLVLATFFLAVLAAVRAQTWLAVGSWALASGTAMAAFWLCREEGVWILPALLVIGLGVPLADSWQRRGRSRHRQGRWRRQAAAGGLVAVIFAVTVGAAVSYVTHRNEQEYGAGLTNDLQSGEFARAYGEWGRVRGVPLTDLVPINEAQRKAVYAVSPAARELEPYLEDPANPWRGFGCDTDFCADFQNGGGEVWAVREAAADAGYFDDEAEVQAYFARVADEIHEGCSRKELECAPALIPGTQPFLRASPWPVLRSSGKWLYALWGNSLFYRPYDTDGSYPMTPEDRIVQSRGMAGVPPSDAAAKAQNDRFDEWRWLYQGWAVLYRIGFAALLVAAGVGAVAAALRARRRRTRSDADLTLSVLVLALAAAVLVRVVLFAVVATTEFNIDPRYHYCSRMMLVAMAAIGAARLFQRPRHGPRPMTRAGADNAPTGARVRARAADPRSAG